MLTARHDGQRRGNFFSDILRELRRKQREGFIIRKTAHHPEAFTPVQTERTETIRLSQNDQCPFGQPRAAHKGFKTGKPVVTVFQNRKRPVLLETFNLAEAKTQGPRTVCAKLQYIVPLTGVYIRVTNLYAMIARIAHDLGRCIKPHGLRIE